MAIFSNLVDSTDTSMTPTLDLPVINYFWKVNFDPMHQLKLTDVQKKDLKRLDSPYDTEVSGAAIAIWNNVIPKIAIGSLTIKGDSLIALVNSTDIQSNYPGVYELIRLVIYETWIISYINNSDASYLPYITKLDLKRDRRNINCLCDFLGYYRGYRFLVEYFRGLEISLGYMQNQLEIVLGSDDLRKSLNPLPY